MSLKSIVIRKARKEDKEPIIELMKEHIEFHRGASHDCGLNPYSKEGISNIMNHYFDDSEKMISVGKEDKTIIGYVICGIKERSKIFVETSVGEIIEIFVTPNMRGKGVAKMLIQKCSDWLKIKGIKSLEIKANPENLIENKMWQDIGFSQSQYIIMIKKI